MTQAFNIPTAVANAANAPSLDLSLFGPKRTFVYVGSSGAANVKIWGSADGINFPPITATPLLTLGGESKSITIDDLSLRYRAEPNVAGGVLTVDVQQDCCATGVSHFNTLPLGDFPAGGVVTTSAMVDQFGAFTIAQVSPGQVLTFPPPTDPSATYVRWVSNVKADGTSAGLVPFSLYGLLVLPGASTKIVWSGATWVEGCTGTATPTRTLVSAAGNPVLDSNGTVHQLGAVGVGQSVMIGAGTGDFVVQVVGGQAQIFTDSGQILLDTSAGGPINIGTGLAPKNVTVGGLIGASLTVLQGGTGGVDVQASPTGGVRITTGTTATLTLDSGTTGPIDIGTNANAKTITIGNGVLTTAISLNVGTGNLLLGANATDHASTLGSSVGGSLTTIQGGTAGISIQAAATGPLSAKSGTSGAATFDSGSTGAVHLGDGPDQKSVIVGSVTLASSLALRAGTGGLSIINNGVTWTWPTADGAAGTKLTTNGAGVLSFT